MMSNCDFERFIDEGAEWSKTGCWEEFKDFSRKMKASAAYLQECQKNSQIRHKFFPIYRGHGDKSWELETTLERSMQNRKLNEYHDLVLRARKRYLRSFKDSRAGVKSIEGYPYNTSSLSNLSRLFSEHNQILKIPKELYFWVFLRHYGFPSPLMDWTENADVAAFFAFQKKPGGKYVSVHGLIQGPGGAGNSNLIIINDSSTGKFSFNKRKVFIDRHLKQKSVYSLFYNDGDKANPIFASHEEMSAANKGEYHKNSWGYQFKFNIPASERIKVLHELDAKGINAAKLMANTDSLLETIQNRLLLLRAESR